MEMLEKNTIIIIIRIAPNTAQNLLWNYFLAIFFPKSLTQFSQY